MTTNRAVFFSGVSIMASILIIAPLHVLAQGVPPPAFGQSAVQAPANTVNCFDYYSFGSVQVDVSANVPSAVSGTSITFSGTLKNANPYPVVGGLVYVKIFRERGGGFKDANGPDVVDQYYALDNVSIPAKGQVPITLAWNIPSYAASGDYKIATFFTVAKKFNLLGLPFTDDVVGNASSFKVAGEQSGAVFFKKDAVTAGGKKYFFAAYPPRTDKSAPVTVEAVVANTSKETVTVPVEWKLYHWSQNDSANMITTRSEEVTVPAGGVAKVSFIATDNSYRVYLLQGTVQWHDASSIINVRFVRGGHDRLRINFPSIASYPLKSGQPTTIFSCLHNAGESGSVPGGRLELELLDSSGNIFHSYTYSGAVTGAMMGIAQQFTPEKDYASFTLNAKLYQGETLVDQSTEIYDCKAIDPTMCPKGLDAKIVIGMLAGVLAAAGLWYAARRIKKPQVQI